MHPLGPRPSSAPHQLLAQTPRGHAAEATEPPRLGPARRCPAWTGSAPRAARGRPSYGARVTGTGVPAPFAPSLRNSAFGSSRCPSTSCLPVALGPFGLGGTTGDPGFLIYRAATMTGPLRPGEGLSAAPVHVPGLTRREPSLVFPQAVLADRPRGMSCGASNCEGGGTSPLSPAAGHGGQGAGGGSRAGAQPRALPGARGKLRPR